MSWNEKEELLNRKPRTLQTSKVDSTGLLLLLLEKKIGCGSNKNTVPYFKSYLPYCPVPVECNRDITMIVSNY